MNTYSQEWRYECYFRYLSQFDVIKRKRWFADVAKKTSDKNANKIELAFAEWMANKQGSLL